MNDYKKEFLNIFKELTRSRNTWEVWKDFVDMASYSISNSTEYREDIREIRELMYGGISKKYGEEDFDRLCRLFATTVLALDENPAQDFLGEIFMYDLNLGGNKGQFFTPWHVAELMAEINTSDNIESEIYEKGYISVNDPACGSGVLLMAFANSLKKKNIEYQQNVIFIAQDIDAVVAEMCYIQLTLIGCMGYVVIGNSLTNPITGDIFFPKYDPPENLLYTPLWWVNGANLLPYRGRGQKIIQLKEESTTTKKTTPIVEQKPQIPKSYLQLNKQQINTEKLKRFFGIKEGRK